MMAATAALVREESMRSRRKTLFAGCLFIMSLFFSFARAQDSGFTGIDLLLLIDQSGSMGGETAGSSREGTDPFGLRFEAGQFVMDFMGALANTEINLTGTVRLGVIYFGDPQRSRWLDWEILAPLGGNWDSQRALLYNRLDALAFGEQNYNYTNFLGAFELGRDMFDRLTPLPSGQQNARAVIVVTDGEPCAAIDNAPGNCVNDAANQRQLEELSRLVQRAFPDPIYRTYIVGIETSLETYWDQYRDLWFDIVREPNPADPQRAARVDSPDEMRIAISRFAQDIRSLVARSAVTIPCPDPDGDGMCEAYIPPYTRLARVRIFKSPENITPGITIYNPAGAVVPASGADVTVDGANDNTIEVWTIERPAEGIWRVDVDDTVNTVEVEVDQNFAQAELLFDDPPVYYQWQTVPLAPFVFYSVNQGGTPARLPVVIDPAFPITMTATITNPNGVQTTLNIPQDPNPAGDLQPQFRTTFVPEAVGTHEIYVIGQVANVNDPVTGIPPFTPINTNQAGRIQTFSVRESNVTVIADPLLQSQAGEWLVTDSAEFCVIINDRTTGALVPNLTALTVQVELIARTDGQTYPFQLPPVNDAQCSYKGMVTPTQVGEYAIATRGYIPDASGVSKRIFDHTQPFNMRVIPLNYVTLRLLDPSPAPGEDIARSNVVKPAPLFNSEPLGIRAAAYGSDGQPVDLGMLVGGNLAADPNPIMLSIRDANGTDVTGDSRLTPITPTTHELISDRYGPGSYTILVTGKPLPLRACRCAYANDAAGHEAGRSATRLVERVIPVEVAYWAAGALIALSASSLGIWGAYRYLKSITSNPLTGTLYFFMESQDPHTNRIESEHIGTLYLNQFKRNTKRLRKDDIPTSTKLPIKWIEITTYDSKELSRSGQVSIKALLENGAVKTLSVAPGGNLVMLSEEANGTRFLIAKDPADDITYTDDI
jgi:hypothetical protein